MIPCAEFLPGAKIRMARAMLLEQHVLRMVNIEANSPTTDCGSA
jgi:hypothetical protein